MSAVLLAVFNSHASASDVRTRLVHDGFPTDRVALTSTQDLGPAGLVPRREVADKLMEHFRRVLQSAGNPRDELSVRLVQRAVLEGKAALTVQPRGDTETQRALQVIEAADPVQLQSADLENQALEHAATESETPALTWFGKVLAAPGAPDTTGTAKLP